MYQPRIFIVDVSSFIFRAFYALPPLSNSEGRPTQATLGFLNMLVQLFEEYQPENVVCVFDSKTPSFRKTWYQQYKSNRAAPPEDLIPQFDDIRKAVDLLGIPAAQVEGIEADDIIGAFVQKLKASKEQGAEVGDVAIVSSDKDLMQLVDSRTRLVDTMKKKVFGPDEVKEKLGVWPNQVVDYLALVGDASDFIPGVEGIGPKTASDLLLQYGDLEGVLSHADMVKGKRGQLLKDQAEMARLSRRLATVLTSFVDIEREAAGDPAKQRARDLSSLIHEDLKWKGVPSSENRDALVGFLRKLGLEKVLQRFVALDKRELEKESVGIDESPDSLKAGSQRRVLTRLVGSVDEWRRILEGSSGSTIWAFDTETKGERWDHREMVGLSFCAGPDQPGYYLPFLHEEGHLERDVCLALLADALESRPRGAVVAAHNLKYDWMVLRRSGQEGRRCAAAIQGLECFDTMVAHYLCFPESRHGLDVLASQYLSLTLDEFPAVLKRASELLGRPVDDFSQVPLEMACSYAGADALVTRSLCEPLSAELDAQLLHSLFQSLEMPLVFVLAEMEEVGVKVDASLLDKMSIQLEQEVRSLEALVYSRVGHEFNLGSPKQLGHVLFEELKLPVVRKTKTGFSTDVEVLERLAPLHEVPSLLLRYRELTKLKSTYVDVLGMMRESDGRVHAQFNQTVTGTGRLSSSNPNLQNIPIKTETGRQLRRAFIAEENHVLIGADYSQIELRILAHLSRDEALTKAFHAGVDVHRQTASDIFGTPVDEVADHQRQIAKAINFGLVYGKTAFGLAQELGLTRTDAQRYIESYFRQYAGVKSYMDQQIQRVRDCGYAETFMGRKRRLPEIHSKNPAIRANAERMAMNTPVQGSAADLIKKAMLAFRSLCERDHGRIWLLLQVHDELVVEAPREIAEEVRGRLVEAMTTCCALSVPLAVESSIGGSWFDL